MSAIGVPTLNLLPGRWVRARRSRKELRRWLSLSAAVLVVVAAPCLLLGLHMRSAPLQGHARADQLEREIGSIRAEIPALDARLRAALDSVLVRERAARRLRWGTLIEPVVAMLPEDARVTALSGAIEGDETQSLAVRATFITRAQAPARACVVRLERSGLFDRVDLVETQRTNSDGNPGVVATIRMQIDAPTVAQGGTP